MEKGRRKCIEKIQDKLQKETRERKKVKLERMEKERDDNIKAYVYLLATERKQLSTCMNSTY